MTKPSAHIVLFLLSILILAWLHIYAPDANNGGPWYLGCADASGQEYLITTKDKPIVKDGFIFIGKDVFLTPMPMMTCRAVRVKDLEKEKKVLPDA